MTATGTGILLPSPPRKQPDFNPTADGLGISFQAAHGGHLFSTFQAGHCRLCCPHPFGNLRLAKAGVAPGPNQLARYLKPGPERVVGAPEFLIEHPFLL